MNPISEDSSFFTQFSLIIASNLPEPLLLPLSRIVHCVAPLVVIQSFGLIGYMRLQYRCHEVIESKPDNDKYDLRIAEAFPELVSYCDSFNFDLESTTMNQRERYHVPYIVLLYKAIVEWKIQVSLLIV